MHRSRGRRSSRKEVQGGAWSRFKNDLRDVRDRYGKQTSGAHKRFVLLLLVVGVGLRIWQAFLPITPTEAVAYVDYALRPINMTLSDYSHPINHVFHSVLTKWSTGIFGVSLITLRLPALLASVLVLPLFYLFVRSMFNRYIALLTLALLCASPCLIELGSLAHGYSMAWLCMVLALLLGRHLVRENNAISAIFLGLVLAFGMWAVPSSITAAMLVFFWVLFSILTKYDRSLGERLGVLGLGLLVFLATTVLLYLPVIMVHGIDQLFNHVTEDEHSWKAFSLGYPDDVLALWVWIIDPSSWWAAVLGFAGMVQAAYISAKYRTLIIAMLVAAVPFVLVLCNAGTPWQWGYALFFFHLGMAIGIFYLLKFIQDKIITGFGKRTRTAWSAMVLLVAFAVPGIAGIQDRANRVPEAEACVDYLTATMVKGDAICVDPYWRAMVTFQLLAAGRDPAALQGPPTAGHRLYSILEPTGSTVAEVHMHCKEPLDQYGTLVHVKDWERMEIFAAPMR